MSISEIPIDQSCWPKVKGQKIPLCYIRNQVSWKFIIWWNNDEKTVQSCFTGINKLYCSYEQYKEIKTNTRNTRDPPINGDCDEGEHAGRQCTGCAKLREDAARVAELPVVVKQVDEVEQRVEDGLESKRARVEFKAISEAWKMDWKPSANDRLTRK